MSRHFRALIVIAVAVVAGACSIKEQKAPGLTGPSSLALSINAVAAPSTLVLDGTSQSVVTVTATGSSGAPEAGLPLDVSVSPTGWGKLSQSQITTGSDGRAAFAFVGGTTPVDTTTMPASVTITLTPGGAYSGQTIPRTLTIALAPQNGSNAAPVASFTYLPAAPEVNSAVKFDASGTTDEGVVCGASCTYAWDFGDGSTGTGVTVSHVFAAAKTYSVKLVATDARGAASATAAQNVAVATPVAPTASFSVNPAAPSVFQSITLDASASHAATGHTIAKYQWSFDDGTTDSSSQAIKTKTFSTTGSYSVRLTVTDDLGQISTAATTTVVVSSGLTITVSPTAPKSGNSVILSVTAPTATTPLTASWDFGDGGTATGTTVNHTFTVVGGANTTYVVRVTVTDGNSRTATTTQNVAVVP